MLSWHLQPLKTVVAVLSCRAPLVRERMSRQMAAPAAARQQAQVQSRQMAVNQQQQRRPKQLLSQTAKSQNELAGVGPVVYCMHC